MDEALKGRWISALRSGDYNQTDGVLADGQGGFCCLGVLCDLLQEDGVVEAGHMQHYYSYNGHHSSALLPGDLHKRLGLAEGSGDVFLWSEIKDFLTEDECNKITEDYKNSYEGDEISPDSRWSLANLNDAGASFETISKIIEVKL